jgi:hypothetical protein
MGKASSYHSSVPAFYSTELPFTQQRLLFTQLEYQLLSCYKNWRTVPAILPGKQQALNKALAVCSILFLTLKTFFMRKLYLPAKILFIALTAAFLFTSCKRDQPVINQHIKLSITTWYRVSPTAPTPVVVNGVTYVSLANLVVGGDGTAATMGKFKSYANTLAYGTDAEASPSGSIGAPVTEIPGYPILGAPLPLIQTGDFDAVPAVLADFHVPASVQGNVINLVLYNDRGDALFLSNIPGTGTSTPVSATVGGYTNETLILGGAGKFIHAIGKLDNSGQFSFIAPYDGQDNYEGWISY